MWKCIFWGHLNFSQLPHAPNIYGGNIDVSFVLSSKGTLVCNSSSSVLFLNRISPSLLHTFVAYTTQLSIAIQHTRNSFLNPHVPRERLRASSCYCSFLPLPRDCFQHYGSLCEISPWESIEVSCFLFLFYYSLSRPLANINLTSSLLQAQQLWSCEAK